MPKISFYTRIFNTKLRFKVLKHLLKSNFASGYQSSFWKRYPPCVLHFCLPDQPDCHDVPDHCWNCCSQQVWKKLLNKTKYFRLRLTDEVGTEILETDLRLTRDWPGTDLRQTYERKMKIQCLSLRQTCADRRTDRQSDTLSSWRSQKLTQDGEYHSHCRWWAELAQEHNSGHRSQQCHDHRDEIQHVMSVIELRRVLILETKKCYWYMIHSLTKAKGKHFK